MAHISLIHCTRNPKDVHNSRKFIVGNAFNACVLGAFLLATLMPIAVFLYGILIGKGLNIFSEGFLYPYFMISLLFGFYGLILSTLLGVPTLLILNYFRLNYPLLLFIVGSLYVILILAIIVGNFDFLHKSALIWLYIFSGGFCGFTDCYLFNKKCQSQLANSIPNS